MDIVTDHDEIDLAYPLPPDVVAALAAVIRDEREQEDEEWAAFIARQEPCEMENVKCKMENERTPVGRDDPIAPPTPVGADHRAARVCERCGAAFVPTKDNQKYCSPECARKAERARYESRHPKPRKTLWEIIHEQKRERERMRARLAERDAAYEREFGSAAQTGAVRGRVAGGSFRGFPLVSSMSYYG